MITRNESSVILVGQHAFFVFWEHVFLWRSFLCVKFFLEGGRHSPQQFPRVFLSCMEVLKKKAFQHKKQPEKSNNTKKSNVHWYSNINNHNYTFTTQQPTTSPTIRFASTRPIASKLSFERFCDAEASREDGAWNRETQWFLFFAHGTCVQTLKFCVCNFFYFNMKKKWEKN